MEKKKIIKIILGTFLIVILIVGSFICNLFLSQEEENNDEIAYIDITSNSTSQITETNNFYIDIKGEVKNPGVYLVSDGMIVQDAINLAGGLTKKAYTGNINLSLRLEKEMVIYIYNKNSITTTTTIPTIINNAEVKNNSSSKEQTNGLININTATLEELTSIPNIGESKANSIIEYRKTNKFNSIEDIMNVSGIGQSLYEKIKDYITV